MLAYAVNKLFLPGKSETFFVIMDLANFYLTSVPFSHLRQILGAILTNFRGRGFKVCVLNAHWAIRAGWHFIRTWVDDFTA